MAKNSRYALCALSLLVAACSGSVDALRPVEQWQAKPCESGTARGEVRMEFFGTAGFKIQWAGEALLTGPYFSNPGMLASLLGAAPSNDYGKSLADQVDVSDVRGLIVGQAHYDHLADVPLVAPRLPESAKIWVSRTGRFLLEAAGVESDRIRELNTLAGNWRHAGQWIPIGRRIRVMALHSEHAPHLMGMKFLGGHIDEPLDGPPDRASDWLEGQTFTFVIDLLDDGAGGEAKPVFRIHYRDSASNPPWGFHPPLGDSKRVDAALVCVASFSQVKDYPEALIRDLQPRSVVLEHWENFFRRRDESLQTVPFLNTEEFLIRLKSALPADAEWVAPKPGAHLSFPVCD